MFKVICVNSGTPGKTHDNLGNKGVFVPKIFVGSEYTVVDVMENEHGIFYELLERPADILNVFFYDSKLFSELSDLDETELVNEKKLQSCGV